MGLRGENVPYKKPKRVRFGQRDLSEKGIRKARGKKAIKQADKAANKLRIAKAFLNKKDLTKPDEKILINLVNSLGKKYGKEKGYKSIATLRDWVANKKGIRNKALIQTGTVRPEIGDEALRFPKAAYKSTSIQNLRDKQNEEARQAKFLAAEIKRYGKGGVRDPSGMEYGPQPTDAQYQAYLARQKNAKKKDDWAEDTEIGFGPRTEKEQISATPTGTVYHGAKSKAPVSPRGAVSKAPEVSSRTQTSKEKQLSPFETAFANARKKGLDVFPFKGKKYTTELASPPRKRKSPPPAPKRKPTQKVSKEDQPVKLEDWSGGVATAVRPPLKPLEGGVRYKKLPDWLGGGEIKIDSTFEEEKGDNVTHGKRGGQVKKGVKKTKTKARRRAALRGHRAELRGG